MAKLTINGMYNYLKLLDDDLFKNLQLPEGIDKDTLTRNIILKSGEFEVLYADPFFMQEVIGTWSNKWQRTFIKWIEALNLEYNPLDNYDRIESWTESDSSSHSSSASGTGTESSSNTQSSTQESLRSAFNSNAYEPNTENEIDSEGTSTGTSSTSNQLSEETSHTNTKEGRAHGNIGVTTSAALLAEHLSLVEWNVYEHITDLFLQEFVIPIY